MMTREIKFRVWNKETKKMMSSQRLKEMQVFALAEPLAKEIDNFLVLPTQDKYPLMQYTGLKDKNGSGLTEVYEGDIISLDGTLKGNIYEDDKEATDIVIPHLGTKAWEDAYKEAVDRGYNYSE